MKTMKKKHQDLSKIFKTVATETKAADEGRKLVVKISTINADRSGDVVDPAGMICDNFFKNPVVSAFHKYDELPIAKCTGLKVSGTDIMADVEFPEAGLYEKSDVIYEMYKQGFLNAWSIGFRAMEYEPIEDGGYRFKKWELFEFAAVLVPDNPEALTVMRSKGINVDLVIEEKKEIKKVDPPAVDNAKLLEDANAKIKTLETELTEIKAGRTISSAHESILRECVSMHKEMIVSHKKCVKNIRKILSTVAEPSDNSDDGKSIKMDYLNSLTRSLKQTAGATSLTLKLLNSVKREAKN